jgi:hypothetical protein
MLPRGCRYIVVGCLSRGSMRVVYLFEKTTEPHYPAGHLAASFISGKQEERLTPRLDLVR